MGYLPAALPLADTPNPYKLENNVDFGLIFVEKL